MPLPELIKELKDRLPPYVVDVRTERGTDAGGEPILWAWAIVRNSQYEYERNKDIKQQIFEALMDKGDWTWVVASARTATEQADLDRTADSDDPEFIEWTEAPAPKRARGKR
jgi:hypothetical protein